MPLGRRVPGREGQIQRLLQQNPGHPTQLPEPVAPAAAPQTRRNSADCGHSYHDGLFVAV